MTTRGVRPWCAEAQYSGLKPFRVGTAVLPSDARHDEIVTALHNLASTILPDGFRIIRPMGGSLFFSSNERDPE